MMFHSKPRPLLTLMLAICIAGSLAGCGTDSDKKPDSNTKPATPDKQSGGGTLTHADGTVGLTGETLTVTSTSGDTLELTLGPDVQVAQVRAMASASERARVYYRDGTPPIAVRVASASATAASGTKSATGLVTLAEDGRLSIATADGQQIELSITPANAAEFDLAHLREHIAQREPITVYYTGTGKRLSAVAYEDA